MKIIETITAVTIEFVQSLAVSLGIFLIMYLFVMQNYRVQGPSMEPTFYTGENLIIEKVSYYFHQPERGDIVVFHAPNRDGYDYIKRIIALPGDTVKISRGHFYVNGTLLDETNYLDPLVITSEERYLQDNKEFTIPSNNYFVAGDNRTNSSDSRDFGPVPVNNIVGRAWIRYWPPKAMGIVNAQAKNK